MSRELPDSVIDCLKNQMFIEMEHFLEKYFSFDEQFRIDAAQRFSAMLNTANDIRRGKATEHDLIDHYFEEGSHDENEFLQAMYDCFRELSAQTGEELKRSIYAHVNRGGEDWFPLVIIDKKMNDYNDLPKEVTVYRGCSVEEFYSKNFRQSWSVDKQIATIFAFTHFSNLDKHERVVVKALVDRNDIAWNRKLEGEVVLLPGFKPLCTTIAMTYDDYYKKLAN
ncbi:hypothetical protein [Photobacterium lipolyticum]|uniref:Uncharacterized protein n=1 Tax=Photobacterium lipolyticum TaxID=266810 RepID=A0A2T3N1B5_9GAMM|nr:hypothetical protein [Photobacterium lipolyticum]PSW06061.1 hypothetical protein C9I89_05980 [Photobacterium lipolyticum]